MTQEQQRGRERPGLFFTALAAIGLLALLSCFAFIVLVVFLVRSGGQVPVLPGGPKIGILEIDGTISRPESYLKALREFRDDGDVRAVVVRIDSPGGAVGASQELFQELRSLDREKPVVASLCSVAASGGYYAAIGARKILCNPGTITGSIGVIMKIPNVGPLMDKLGIRTTVLKSGRFKDLGSMTRDLTGPERELIQKVLDDVHRQFIEDVAKSRGLSPEAVAALADGRVFTGRQALQAHLVDKLGNFSAAVSEAAALAGIKEEPVLVYPKKDRITILKQLLEEGGAKGMVRALREVLMGAAFVAPN